MSISKYPELVKFLNTAVMDTEQDQDLATTLEYTARLPADALDRLITQTTAYAESGSIDVSEVGTESNRWFASEEEAQDWLQLLIKGLGTSTGATDTDDTVVKDSNGAVLLEGDNVTVIKDLKVKGGNSDLKRGTLVRKIHLTSDPGLVECRVDGSTLVLKTEFLKKTV